MLGLALAMSVVSVPLVLLGARILRTSGRGAPERTLGGMFLLAGLVIAPRLLSSRALGVEVTNLWLTLSLLSQAGLAVVLVLLVVFTQRVFRPQEAWARRLRAGLVLAVLVVAYVAAAQPPEVRETSAWVFALSLLSSASFLWAFVECLRYARMMRQRVALGLADPVVANRFACWCLWTGALGLAPLAILPVRLYALSVRAAGQDVQAVAPMLYALVAAVAAVAVSVAAVGLWLSFFPPRFWLRRLAASAPDGSGSA